MADETAQHDARHHDLLLHHLKQSYMDLVPDQQSNWDRNKIFGKIDILATAVLQGRRISPELSLDVSTLADRSKLVTLVIGLKYRLMKTVMISLHHGSQQLGPVTMKTIMNWIATISALQAQLLPKKPLVLH